MNLPAGRRAPSGTDLVLVALTCSVVFAAALEYPAKAGILMALTALGVGVVLLGLRDPLLALVVVLAASFLRLAQKEYVSTEFLTPLLVLLVVSYAAAVKRGGKRVVTLGVVEWLMAAYLVWNLLSWTISHQLPAVDPVTGEDQQAHRWILTGTVVPFAGYVLAKGVADDERGVRWVVRATVVMSAYSAWVSILQFHGPRALVWPRYIVDAPNWVDRANGVFNQPVANGLVLTLGFLSCLFLASRPGARRPVQLLLYVVALASAYGVYLTHTRVALLSLVVTILMGMLFARGWRRAFVVSAVAAVTAVTADASEFFSTDRAAGGVASAYELLDRLNIMATAWRAIQEQPFFGVGIARFLAYNTWHHVQWSPDIAWDRGYNLISHETELGIAAELGIPGVLLWVGVVLGVLRLMWRAARELPDDPFVGRPVALLGAIALITMVINGTTVDLRLLDFATLMPFLFAGMAVVQLERHRAGPMGPHEESPGSSPVGRPTRVSAVVAARETARTATDR